MNSRYPLNPHWSPEQALAVYECLQGLSEQLWHQYRAEFVDLFGERAVEVLQPPNLYPDVDVHQLPLDGFDAFDNDGDFPF